MKKLFYLSSLLLLIYSCKKEPDPHVHDEPDTTNPVVTINTPNDSLTFSNGDTVFITGSVTDNDLHSGLITITNDSSAAVMFTQDHYVHELQSANFDFFYVVNVTQSVTATLTVRYQDHTPNYGTATRKLFFIP